MFEVISTWPTWAFVTLYFGGLIVWATGIALYDKLGLFRVLFCVVGIAMQEPGFHSMLNTTNTNLAGMADVIYITIMIVAFYSFPYMWSSHDKKN
jgi:hypothetical protein